MRLDELTRKSHEAARVRAYQTHTDVIALRIELVRTWSAWIVWAGVVLGLAFTMTNVQQFAANGAPAGSLSWLSAWLLDPMVSLVLIGVLVAEQVTSRWQIDTPGWAQTTKCFALAATYVMNTWQSWSVLSASGIVLHSVPPLLVFTAVEGGPAMREALTRAVTKSLTATAPDTATPVMNTAVNGLVNPAGVIHQTDPGSVQEPVHEPAHGAVREPVPAPVRESTSRRSTNANKATRGKGSRSGGRVLFADYLAMAREHLTADTVTVTPAWCRQVTGCSAGTSVRLAAALSTELVAPTTADPDPFTTGPVSSAPVSSAPVSTTPFTTTAPDDVPAEAESEAA